MEENHCPEEVSMLDLLAEIQPLLDTGIESMTDKMIGPLEPQYVSFLACSVNRAAEGYLHLRRSLRKHASKLMVRPALEALILATAAVKDRRFIFRKFYTEWKSDRHLWAKTPADQAEADKAIAHLEQSFARDFPGYPIERQKISLEQAADMAGLTQLYETQYRIYCRYTHISTDAACGDLDEATDMVDTKMVCWCVLQMLDLMKDHTPADIPDTIPLKQRLMAAAGSGPSSPSST